MKDIIVRFNKGRCFGSCFGANNNDFLVRSVAHVIFSNKTGKQEIEPEANGQFFSTDVNKNLNSFPRCVPNFSSLDVILTEKFNVKDITSQKTPCSIQDRTG